MKNNPVYRRFINHVIPNTASLAREAIKIAASLDGQPVCEYIKKNPSKCIEKAMEFGSIRYKKLVRDAGVKFSEEEYQIDLYDTLPSENKYAKWDAMWNFTESLRQKGMSDCGRMLETIVDHILFAVGIPFETQAFRKKVFKSSNFPISPNPDFLFPSAKHFLSDPKDCIILECKTTLKDRWSQVIKKGTKVFLLTIDEMVSIGGVNIQELNGVTMVVPKNLKNRKYRDLENVITFEDFLYNVLIPSLNRWASQDIIPHYKIKKVREHLALEMVQL